MTSLKKIFVGLFVVAATAAVVSCGSKYNKIKFEDPNKGNTEVYGPDSTQAPAEGAPAEAK